MATPQQWATFFSGRYVVRVDGVDAHQADIRFAPTQDIFCLSMTLSPIGAGGNATGFMHLYGQLCRQGHKAWNNIAQTSSRPLPGGHIFCVYTGTHNDHGFLQGGFTEPGGMTVGVNQPVMPYFKGEIHEEAPANGTQFLFEFICRQARPRPDANYPWNVPR